MTENKIINIKKLRLKLKEESHKKVRGSTYPLGYKTLCHLCKIHPKHTKCDEIYAKIWLIGRAYSVALERRKNKVLDTDEFYDKLVIRLKNRGKKIDKALAGLKTQNINDRNFIKILKAYETVLHVLTDILKNIEKGARENRSFVSKYLHFHKPNLFYIYDKYAKIGLNRIWNIIGAREKYKVSHVGSEYGKYFYKAYILSKVWNIKKARELDILLSYAGKLKDREWEKTIWQ
ncbi:MAG: hypothetical protein PHV55_08135 [Candidatus Omnitrophica bacterium]|nr:hypothetical protein [Candidatus Omnitrophota bacterium]